MSSGGPLATRIVHDAYSWALREYRALAYHGQLDAEQYATILRLVSKRLYHLHPDVAGVVVGSAARAGLDQALLDLSTSFARAGAAPAAHAPDRLTRAWHGLTLELARGLPTSLAATARSRSALRRSTG